MTLFFLSKDPFRCGKSYSNKHLMKGIINVTRMLAWAYYDENGLPHITEEALNVFPRHSFFKFVKKYYNFPWSTWVRESEANWEWSINLAKALCEEFKKVYGHKYGYEPILEWMLMFPPKFDAIRKDITIPPLVFDKWQDFLKPSKVNEDDDYFKITTKLYRYYYVLAKTEIAIWDKRKTPKWWEKYTKLVKSSSFNF